MACLEHIDAYALARRAGGNAVLAVILTAGLCMLVLTVALCCAGVFIKPLEQAGAAGRAASSVVALLGGGGGIAAAAVVAWLGYKQYAQVEGRSQARRQEEVEYAESLLSDECCATGEAVRYEGWYGTVHTFWFENARFVDELERLNPGKVMDD